MTVRWAFPDPSEEPERRRIEARIDEWWSGLVTSWPELVRRLEAGQGDAGPTLVGPGLRALHPLLGYELRRLRDPPWGLALSCETERWVQPFVDTIVARAPKNAPFAVSREREAEPPKLALMTVEGTCGVDASGWAPEVHEGPFGLLSIEWTGSARHESAGAVLVQSLLGEQVMGDWVGAISVKSKGLLGRVFGRASPGELLERFSDARRAVTAKTADRPLLRSASEPADRPWELLTLERRLDRAGCHQPDLERARTANVDFFAASRSGAPFSSCRFSRFGERFAYLQLEGFPEEGLRNTLLLEEALDAALGSFGRVIGGGTGTQFSYVDLVLANPHAAVPILVDVLRRGRFPTGCWLRFFDDVWAKEWVGVWPETPPPPG